MPVRVCSRIDYLHGEDSWSTLMIWSFGHGPRRARNRQNGKIENKTLQNGGPFVYFTSTSSTSKTKVAFGGMTPPAPRSP